MRDVSQKKLLSSAAGTAHSTSCAYKLLFQASGGSSVIRPYFSQVSQSCLPMARGGSISKLAIESPQLSLKETQRSNHYLGYQTQHDSTVSSPGML